MHVELATPIPPSPWQLALAGLAAAEVALEATGGVYAVVEDIGLRTVRALR